jgi:hypothetical protein
VATYHSEPASRCWGGCWLLPAAAEAKVEGAIVFDEVDSSRTGSGEERRTGRGRMRYAGAENAVEECCR